MLNTLPNILSDLSFSQRLNVYESVAWIISGATSDDDKRDLIVRLFQLPNQEWTRIMQAIAGDQTGSQLSLPEAQRQIMLIVAINKRVVAPLGSSYVAQFSLIFMDCVGLYTACSNILKAGINQAGGDGPNGDAAANMHEAQQIRNTRKEILRLFNVFIETADDPHSISTMYLPAILQQVLPQYPSTPKIVRDSEMLTLFTTVIVKLKNLILPQIQEILGALFEATIQMITQNFEDYPEHRSGFYSFLRALNHHCPTALASLPAHGAQMKLVVEAGIWA
ncbi:MAG: putative GPI-anchored wall transfer protein 1, partial [Streblomastix strix]